MLAASINPVDYKLGGIPVVGTMLQGKGVGLDVCGEVVYSPAGCEFKVGDTGTVTHLRVDIDRKGSRTQGNSTDSKACGQFLAFLHLEVSRSIASVSLEKPP